MPALFWYYLLFNQVCRLIDDRPEPAGFRGAQPVDEHLGCRTGPLKLAHEPFALSNEFAIEFLAFQIALNQI